jgi:hypothetical protein
VRPTYVSFVVRESQLTSGSEWEVCRKEAKLIHHLDDGRQKELGNRRKTDEVWLDHDILYGWRMDPIFYAVDTN